MPPKFERRVELYRFECGRCGSAWSTTYEIRQAVDPDSQPIFLVNGSPVSSPRSGVMCPHCGGYRVVGHPENWAPPPPPEPAPTHPERQVAGSPLILVSRRALGGDRTRVDLVMGTTRLVLTHGSGELPDEIRRRLQDPVPAHVAGTSGLFDASHWTDPMARLVWERDGRWFVLAGHAERELLMRAAEELAAHPRALLASD